MGSSVPTRRRHLQCDLRHLGQTMEKIQEVGFTLNVAKCEWAKSEKNYLGNHLENSDLRPQVDKVEVI